MAASKDIPFETRVSWQEGTYSAAITLQGPPLDGSAMQPPSDYNSHSISETVNFRGSDSSVKEWAVRLDYTGHSGRGAPTLAITFSRVGGHVDILEGRASVTFTTHPAVTRDGVVGCVVESFTIPAFTLPLPAENFEIRFSVKYKRTHFVDKRHMPNRSPEEAEFRTCYEMLFDSGLHSDMVFTIGDQKVRAHKGVLAAHVPYFAAMLSSGMIESETGGVEMEAGTDVPVFKEVLRHIYCGKLPAKLAEDCVKFLPFAEKYDLQRLKEACLHRMEKDLSKDNVCDMLIVADLYQCGDLREKCLQRLHEWGPTLETGYLEKLKGHPELLIEVIQKGQA